MPWSCLKCLKSQSADIKQLNYQHCTLNDVPAEVFAFERTLEELYLDSNRIRDLPRPLFHCHGLKVLSIGDNEVHSLPPAIASLINLNHLDVSRNALSSIPDNLKGCKHLSYVDVSVNPLEKLPEGFTQLISLEELYLNDTYLDFLPANFGRLLKLRILELRENNLNTLPKSIARLTHLQRLDIGQNDFSDLPEVIGSLVNLTELWFDSNRIKCVPTFIGNLKKLLHLEASNNNISWIASEIEHCSRLTDLTVSCNELHEIPESIGKLKELVTLKLDDNQISHLPNTIGELTNLEELILSQNDLESLNPCIGLLRKLHILNVDDNMLEELPSEIGSCSGMTILSAHSNKLQWVPAELGHLTNLRVINLSENQLRSLPVSVLNLVNLTALWLSNNQSTPLTTLQQEIDKETGQTVCVNFMLPQSTQETHFHGIQSDRHEIQPGDQPCKVKQHITFATDADMEAPSRLMRAPTPYPKELRAMAKHARSIHHPRKSTRESDEDTPLLGEMVSQEPKDVLIKEAKVKKPGTSAGDHLTKVASSKKSMETNEYNSLLTDYLETERIVPRYQRLTSPVSTLVDEGSAVVAYDCGPVVREAKCVRKVLSSHPIQIDLMQRHSISSNYDQYVQQPPPYHIAAAYSKQALFFRQVESQIQKPTIIHLVNDDEAENITCSKEYENAPVSNSESQSPVVQKSNLEEAPLPPVVEHEIAVLCHEQNETRNEVPLKHPIRQLDYTQHPFIFSERPSSSSSSAIEVDNTPSDSIGVFEEDSRESRLQFSLSIGGSDATQSEQCVESTKEDQEHHSISKPQDQHVNKVQGQESEGFLMQKPQTFTQDKPIMSEGVVAPTPHRPCSPGTLSSPLINSIAFLASKPGASSTPVNIPLRKPSGIPKSISKSVSDTDSNSPDADSGRINDSYDHKHNHIYWQTPLSSRIPQPAFYGNPPPSHISSRRSSVSSSATRPGSVASSIDTTFNATDKPKFIATSDVYQNTNISSNHDDSKVDGEPTKIPMHLEITPLRTLRNQPGTHSRIPAPTKFPNSLLNSNVKARSDLQGKNPKTWMFGPHRNATVFPVTIQKNPGLGFSISGGTKSSTNDKYELEIFISKVHPGGPATGVLLPGDKILEVDGIDFTKLEHDQAVLILRQTSNNVHMMISRQQS